MMDKKDATYCNIIHGNCNERRRKECHRDCKAYKEAVKEAYNKTM